MASKLNNTQAVILVVLVILALVIGPLLTVFMLKTLFGLALEYSLQTWAAAALLNLTIAGFKVSKT